MRNRAKCKLCEDIIESMHSTDYVNCKCGEIAISGGNQELKVFAEKWENFLRIDEEGNIIVPKIVESKMIKEETDENPYHIPSKPDRDELLKLLEDMIEKIEELPAPGLYASVSHYDLLSFMMVVSSIFRSFCKEEI